MKKRILIYVTALLFAISGITSGIIYAGVDPTNPSDGCDNHWAGKDVARCWINNPYYVVGPHDPCVVCPTGICYVCANL